MNNTINLYGLVTDSIVDGPGFRTAIFVQGCPHHCPGCHNPESHDFAGGHDEDTAAILAQIARNPLLRPLSEKYLAELLSPHSVSAEYFQVSDATLLGSAYAGLL